ncbi:uncharacterized protein K444DRAFT_621441 [Hyaloscypha bicolor E]|uniref:Secreted protein n=1 Tax=Hyaloscypha bicolor E TaxID=1095630 RepID=A0A2J6SNL4_9HELO|nr:uncharacterized protein K444DRAFT_621441 [Hyaloscypha bicolor E]PMD52310.1 hypothetical protein K444DRAFT_621441 [Hyaloscypha bicolor E]
MTLLNLLTFWRVSKSFAFWSHATDVLGPGSQERELPIFQTKYFRHGICLVSQGDISIAIVPDRYSHIVLVRYD